MPFLLKTVLEKIPNVSNQTNRQLISNFHRYLVARETSESHQKHNVKIIIKFAEFLKEENNNITFFEVKDKETIIQFLDKRRKNKEEDQTQKWITTWNDYLWRLKYFFRWLYCSKDNPENIEDWETPEFSKIKSKKTKRISPYSEGEIWDKDELLTVVKYEPYLRNKAALTLFWDLNARPHEITLLRIKNVRLREKYGEGEVPYEAKTGSGPILLTCSFPYVRDWLNEHPYRNEPEARLICNLWDGSTIGPDALEKMMKRLKQRIIRLLENDEILDTKEKERLRYMTKTKKWNPYCIRHSSITYDSDYLPEYALKKKVRWSMNSRQGSRYIKNRMGDELKNKILIQNGIILENENKNKPSILNCPRCNLVNAIENKYCSKCSYPLKPEAYEEIKTEEKKRFKELEAKYFILEDKMEKRFQQIISKIDVSKLNYE